MDWIRKITLKTVKRGKVPAIFCLLMTLSIRFNKVPTFSGDHGTNSKNIKEIAQLTPNTQSQVPGVLATSQTNPSFQIWLFPPEDDIISRKIQSSGVYEPEETIFLEQVAASIDEKGGWAVDIGANIGFHTLHMAALGMRVIAFEPSPDTATLLKRSVVANKYDHHGVGSIQIIQAAASEEPGMGRLVRHPDSPGMTILQRVGDSSSLPFGVEHVVEENVELVQPASILNGIIGTNRDSLQLLKVDAEGHELHAFRGVRLDEFVFQYVTFEFFPELLWKAGNTNPFELLLYIKSFDYSCGTHPNSFKTRTELMQTTNEFRTWYKSIVVPAYYKSPGYHLNLYCRKGG